MIMVGAPETRGGGGQSSAFWWKLTSWASRLTQNSHHNSFPILSTPVFYCYYNHKTSDQDACQVTMASSTHDSRTDAVSSSPPRDDGDEVDEAWKDEHPYKTPDADFLANVAWKGTCHCGEVCYYLSREKPLASKYCHCGDCQTMHGVRPPFPSFFLSATCLSTVPHILRPPTLPHHRNMKRLNEFSPPNRLPSSGPLSSRNPTFASPTEPTASPSTRPPSARLYVPSPARSPARGVTRPSWTRAAI